ncbi:MAG: hypothetical protein NTV03_02460 [Candidatus Nomurabacteria bacterium]|nr:hypothetical protein [Candidatus Nomurabacteria bacterium]
MFICYNIHKNDFVLNKNNRQMEKASNGQFREFVGKLLVKGNDENVAKIDKTKIQNAINSLSSAEDTVFENLIRFINNGCRLLVDGFVSKLFQKTNTIKVAKNPKSFTVKENSVRDFLKPVIKREKELKNPDPYVDNDLWNYFKDKTIPGFIEDLVSIIYRFLVNLTHGQILDEAENTGIKKVYTYLEGLSIIRQAILDGEVDKKGTGIFVYFKVEGIDTLFRFDAFRLGDGQLDVDVGGTRLGCEWRAGSGACFSN